MKTIALIWAFLGIFYLNSCSDKRTERNEEILQDKQIENEQKLKKLRHIVLFKFKEGTTRSDISRVEEAFTQLPSKIKEINEFEWGLNNSPEKMNKGFTHGFLLTFDSEEARDIYLPHPDHRIFGELVDPLLEDVFVLDYWTN